MTNLADAYKISNCEPTFSSHQHERLAELNQRLFDRNIPDAPLRPKFGMSQQHTRYTQYYSYDTQHRQPCNRDGYREFSTESVFYPGDARAPIEGFNVDLETELRNQKVALQRGEQGVWVPSSNSELYHTYVPKSSLTGEQPFPLLFQEYNSYKTRIPRWLANTPQTTFNNATRVQRAHRPQPLR